MIVVTLSDCPSSLRGDLTKWLVEINTGVFVGRLSARVRDNLWKRITANVKNGHATMVFGTNNEQRMDFRVHSSEWIPIDFDGLKLVMRPSYSRTKNLSEKRLGFSNASKYRMAQKSRRFSVPTSEENPNMTLFPSTYVVLDIETTGLNAEEDAIIEIGALQVNENEIASSFQVLVQIPSPLPLFIQNLTGITEEMLEQDGILDEVALENLKSFLGNRVICGHNIVFDLNFLNVSLLRMGLTPLNNKSIDTCDLYSRVRNGRSVSKKLKDMAKYCNVDVLDKHRALSDCQTVKNVYDVLRGRLKEER